MKEKMIHAHKDEEVRGKPMGPPTQERRDSLMNAWAVRNGLKICKAPSKGWWSLIKPPYKKPPQQETWGYEPGGDHRTLWTKDGKPYCWVSQPYGLRFEDIQKMVLHATKYGLRFEVNSYPAWHYPGSVVFIIWRHKDEI
jgi:hypothetical protein